MRIFFYHSPFGWECTNSNYSGRNDYLNIGFGSTPEEAEEDMYSKQRDPKGLGAPRGFLIAAGLLLLVAVIFNFA